jgi:hypothetical protein
MMLNMTLGFSLALRDDLLDKDHSVRVTSYSVESRPPEKALRLVVEPRVDDAGQAEIAGTVTNMRGSRDVTQVKKAAMPDPSNWHCRRCM